MRRPAAAAAAGVLAIAAALVPSTTPAYADHGGFHVSGTQLLDANGNSFVARGTSLPHVWFQQQFQMFSDAADLGANSARIVLGSGHQWGPTTAAEVRQVVDECKRLEMVCMLEVHDATGFQDPFGQDFVSILDVVEDYWTDPDLGIFEELQGEEAYVLVNIANEHRGNENAEQWGAETSAAIEAMRAHGYEHTLVVDAPNWGQDWTGTMLDQAPQVASADDLGNTLFSIHMYEVYGSPQVVTDYFDAFEAMGLPLVVGEFGWQHGDPPQPVAWETIMAEAQARGIGWYGWSWSGNSNPAAFLDQVDNFDAGSLTQWGQDLFLGSNGVQATAQCATVFDCDGGEEDTEPPTQPGQPQPVTVGATSATLQWQPSTDNVGVTGYEVYLDGGLSTTTGSTSVTLTGLTPETTYQVEVVARDAAGNTSPASETGTFTTEEDQGGGGACAVSVTANPWTEQPGQGGFTAHLQLTNTGEQAVDGWTLAFDLAPGHGLVHGWSATWEAQGQTLTADNLGWNRVINPDSSVEIGFNGSWSGSFAEPSGFTLNGQQCD